jgi:putative IMPACT (imprinted ancient) family translation regulator
MLEVLRHQDLDGVAAAVVRYYGGIKLGAGGLVRAYTDAVAQALLHAVKVPRVLRQELRCSVPYALEGLLRRELPRFGAELLAVTHADQVEFRFSIGQPAAAALVEHLNEAGNGRLIWPSEC